MEGYKLNLNSGMTDSATLFSGPNPGTDTEGLMQSPYLSMELSNPELPVSPAAKPPVNLHLRSDSTAINDLPKKDSRKTIFYGISGIILALGSAFLYFDDSSSGDSVVNQILAMIAGDESGMPLNPLELGGLPKNAKQNAKQNAGTGKAVSSLAKEGLKALPSNSVVSNEIPESDSEEYKYIFQNPYWYLPNAIGEPTSLNKLAMAANSQTQYRNGMNHTYIYQTYQTLRNIRYDRYRNSEVFLTEGLSHRKFWVRMEGLIGLAEFNIPVNTDTVEAVLEGTRSSLVANYFKRINKRSSQGAFFIARQALRLVGPAARLNILKALSKKGWRNQKMYLAAATFDPSDQVKKWVQNELETQSLTGRNLMDYKEIVTVNYRKSLEAKESGAKVIEIGGAPLIPVSNGNISFFDETKASKTVPSSSLEEMRNFDILSPEEDGFKDINGTTSKSFEGQTPNENNKGFLILEPEKRTK